MVFDRERMIALKLNTPDGIRTIRVRFPSDEEWTERQRCRKIIVKNLGRNRSESTVAGGENVDAVLVAKIRVEEDGNEVDPFEATRIVEQLSEADVDDVEPLGGSFRVSLRVLGGMTTHVFRMPSAKDVFEYKRGCFRLIDL